MSDKTVNITAQGTSMKVEGYEWDLETGELITDISKTGVYPGQMPEEDYLDEELESYLEGLTSAEASTSELNKITKAIQIVRSMATPEKKVGMWNRYIQSQRVSTEALVERAFNLAPQRAFTFNRTAAAAPAPVSAPKAPASPLDEETVYQIDADKIDVDKMVARADALIQRPFVYKRPATVVAPGSPVAGALGEAEKKAAADTALGIDPSKA